jgi:hypothetical protein
VTTCESYNEISIRVEKMAVYKLNLVTHLLPHQSPVVLQALLQLSEHEFVVWEGIKVPADPFLHSEPLVQLLPSSAL